MGLSKFSPTAGLLTGIHVVEPSHEQAINRQGEAEVFGIAQAVAPIATELGWYVDNHPHHAIICPGTLTESDYLVILLSTVAQLAVAWAISNPNVATCVFGTSKPARVAEQVEALALVSRLTPELMVRRRSVGLLRFLATSQDPTTDTSTAKTGQCLKQQ